MEKRVYNGNLSDKFDYASYKFLTVTSCGVHVNASHITERRNGRSDYHLLYVESGELVCEAAGCTQRLVAGGYVLYPPGVSQKYEQNGGICYWVHFSGTAAEELLTDAGLKNKMLFCGDKPNKMIISAFEKMVYRYITTGHQNDLALSADLISLFSIFRNIRNEQRMPSFDKRICAVITHLNKHFSEPVDIQKCAQIACLSPGHFAHIFKETTGTSPYAYVLTLRLEKAVEMLALLELPVAEIAYRVGFDNPLYFSKLFKKRYAVSPTDFRKKKWKNISRRTKSSGCD